MRRLLVLFLSFFLLTASANAKDMRFVQISDARFSKDSKENVLQKVISDVNKQKNVSFVVFTGDNIAKPSMDDLEAFLKEIKKLKTPFYIAIGDKDVNKFKHLSKTDYVQYLKKNIRKYKPEAANYVFEKDGILFLVADGSKDVIPSTNGYYKDEMVSWIDDSITQYQNDTVIIFQHFPLIPPSNKESYFTYKPENYLETVAKYKNVKAIISGHFGVNSEKNINGITHITTAGIPYYRIIDILDYDTNPTIWAELKLAE